MKKNIPEVIGEGSYGCVHRPSLECNRENINYKNKVSKISCLFLVSQFSFFLNLS